MICRSERLTLKGVFTDFTERKCSVGTFTAQLEPFFHSRDKAVKELSHTYAAIYEEVKDAPAEKVCFDKSQWDELQRILLFLGSDVPYAEPRFHWRIDPFQVLAIVALAVAIWRYVALAVPFEMAAPAAIVFLLALCRSRYLRKRDATRTCIPQDKLYPFLSVQSIIRQLRLQPDFKKRRAESATLPTATGIGDAILSGIILAGLLLILWPFFLLLLCLPVRREEASMTALPQGKRIKSAFSLHCNNRDCNK